MGVLIGGSGSSGTTLLRSYLNRHPDVRSGAELNFFNKEIFFTNWESHRHRLLKKGQRGVSTNGWFPYPGTNLLHGDYGWSLESLEKIIESSPRISDFSERFFSPSMKESGARLWIEKTPSNAYCFPSFLDEFPEGKVIHVIRDPYDSVASMVKRGMSEYFAAGVWIYNNAAALRAKKSTRYCQVRYEDLVRTPDTEFAKIFKFLELNVLSFSDLSTFLGEEDEAEEKSSWRSSPVDNINANSLGAFLKLDRKSQERIVEALSAFEIQRRTASCQRLYFTNAQTLCEELGFNYRRASGQSSWWLREQLLRDLAIRTLKRYRTMPPNYPGGLKSFF